MKLMTMVWRLSPIRPLLSHTSRRSHCGVPLMPGARMEISGESQSRRPHVR